MTRADAFAVGRRFGLRRKSASDQAMFWSENKLLEGVPECSCKHSGIFVFRRLSAMAYLR